MMNAIVTGWNLLKFNEIRILIACNRNLLNYVKLVKAVKYISPYPNL